MCCSFIATLDPTASAQHCATPLLRLWGGANHTVEVCDLYAEGFVPTMSADERGRYYGDSPNLQGIEDYISALQRAEALLLVYPTWWFGLPAMLKGGFDPRLAARRGLPSPQRWGSRAAANKHTSVGGGHHLRLTAMAAVVYWLAGPAHSEKCLPPVIVRGCKLDWIALTRMDTCTAKQRARFLATVNRRLSRWR
jgi:NAD(P)H dehydrogenase (quinone)